MPDRRELSNEDALKMELQQKENGSLKSHKDRVTNILKVLGADTYDLLVPESKILPIIIHPNEVIVGVVYGRYTQENGKIVGRGALVATDKRVILVDKKPLFIKLDEISYEVVSGVTYTKVSLTGYVTLHTKEGDIKIRTFNHMCAKSFVEAIERKIFDLSSA